MEFESSPEQIQIQEQLMNEEEIRMLNSDFNYKHYGQFYEALEKDPKQNFEMMVSTQNLLSKMWNKVTLDPAITANYEQWLEDEVWTYFD